MTYFHIWCRKLKYITQLHILPWMWCAISTTRCCWYHQEVYFGSLYQKVQDRLSIMEEQQVNIGKQVPHCIYRTQLFLILLLSVFALFLMYSQVPPMSLVRGLLAMVFCPLPLARQTRTPLSSHWVLLYMWCQLKNSPELVHQWYFIHQVHNAMHLFKSFTEQVHNAVNLIDYLIV